MVIIKKYHSSAKIDFTRQKLTYTDVRFWRLESVPTLKELSVNINVVFYLFVFNYTFWILQLFSVLVNLNSKQFVEIIAYNAFLDWNLFTCRAYAIYMLYNAIKCILNVLENKIIDDKLLIPT